MRLIALVFVALAVSASALPHITSEQDLRLEARKANGGDKKGDENGGNSDPQTSLTLDPRVICDSFKQDGNANKTAGQAPSLTSPNNFINYCRTVPDKPLTNGQQKLNGSCNPTPMGVIASVNNMPSCKFVSPKNLDTIPANTTFTIQMKVKNLATGFFANPEENFLAAPQQVDKNGNIIGHSHVVVQALKNLSDTEPVDPSQFAFFKGLNDPADKDGILSVEVSGGLPPGAYKISSINTSSNHAPVAVAPAAHGSVDDQIYVGITSPFRGHLFG
ncbi:hypothetical protein BC826DRAFT_909645 [Russula brevipes]|nr:hypothetical protein BC826DRAFT_909645 [Russula brevipes]